MTHYVFTSQVDANIFKASVDSKLGYPRPAIHIGGGIHGPGGAATGYTDIVPHPTLPLWAHLNDGNVQGLVTTASVAVPITGSVQTLDASWGSVAVAVGQVAQVG